MNLLSFLLFLPVFAQQQISVKSVTPTGSQRHVDQIRIEFSQPMVKLGEYRVDTPAQSDCFKNGQGRWVDTKNWVYDFNKHLPGGHACEIKVGGKVYSFNTGGPHISNVFPQSYNDIDPEQTFLVFLDSDYDKKSLEQGAYFVIQGLGDRVPAKIIEGGEADKIRASALEQFPYEKENFQGPWVVLKSTRTFPADTKISLVWSTGVKSSKGIGSVEDETFEFNVQKAFKADFSCERENTGSPCIPLLTMRLSFTAPIAMADAKAIYVSLPDGKKVFAKGLDGKTSAEQISYLEFPGPFPVKAKLKVVLPAKIKDDQNRELINQSQFPLQVETGDDPSLLKFAAEFGVIENQPNAALPVTMRQVEKSVITQFSGWTGKFSAKKFKDIIVALGKVMRDPYGAEKVSITGAVTQKIQVKKPLAAADTEVVGVPLKGPGFYVVEMQSALLGKSLLGKSAPYYVRSAALVTDMAVHLKYINSVAWVWVTQLKSGVPVMDAQISLYDVAGRLVGAGKTDKQGWSEVQITSALASNDNGPFMDGFFAVAEKGDDFTFTHSGWDQGIEPWRFQIGSGERQEGLVGHTILDRSLLRPEQNVSGKVVLRKTTARGLVLPGATEWPSSLSIVHDSGLQTFNVPMIWDKKLGTANWQWSIPAGAKLGRWSLRLNGPKKDTVLDVGFLNVESFRIPLLQVRVQGAKPYYVQESSAALSVMGNYFSGGPAQELPLKIRWSVEQSSFSPQDSDYNEFLFANGGVKEGVFRSGDEENARFIAQSGVQEHKLDKAGNAAFDISKLKYGAGPQRLRVEAEYKDPNGIIQNSVRAFGLWPSSVVLGVKADGWTATPSRFPISVVALNLQQQPIKNQNIQVDLYTSRYYSHRKRLVGGFYAYEDFQEVKKIGELCRGQTDNSGVFKCTGKPKVSGSVIAVVTTKDAKGNLSQANVNQWVVTEDETQWFGSQADDRADLIPFKKSYEPGETAEFQLRTPFKDAKVLVTVERESVLYQEVIDVKGENPIIRVPIKKEYAPNVVVSAFAVRGRLSDPKATALVDLGKPAFKLGLSEIKVGWSQNTLKVQVESDKKSYHARDKAKVKIKVTDHQGKAASAGQVALVAVDEGLLELQNNSSWDLLTAMMGLRPYSVRTATAQSFVIGKRHFGLKAVPIGGDGGGGGARRELFDTLLYWNANVKLDKNGEAQAEITLNDSTTSFRIVAIALQGAEQFGTGWTSIQSSQDLMILPGLSSTARVGDQFQASFTVRNAAAKAQEVKVSLKTIPQVASLQEYSLKLEPGATRVVSWSVRVPETAKINYVISAKDSQGKIIDEVGKAQTILPLRTARIYQSQFAQWPEMKDLSIAKPAQADPNSTAIMVDVAASLTESSVAGLKDFWKNYYYSCLEQQVSRTVTLNDQNAWKKIEQKLSLYMDSKGLLKYFPSEFGTGSVQLTTYVVSVAHEAGFKFSEENEVRLMEALGAYAEGRMKDSTEAGRVDEVIKKVSTFEALSRYRKLNVGLLDTVKFEGMQWPLATLTEWYEILRWEKDIPQREAKLAQLESLLANRFYFTAKRLTLRNESADSMPWLMRDPDGAILKLILATADDPKWKESIPRLMQGSLLRQQRGAWGLTTTNAWGRLALSKFDAKFQKDKVDGTFAVGLGADSQKQAWKQNTTLHFDLPLKAQNGTLTLNQTGIGKPWMTVSSKAALPVTKTTFAGFTVDKKITPIEQKAKGRWSVGDTAQVELIVTAKTPQTWVVVEDPLPISASVLEASTATAIERKEELVRFYFDWFSGETQTISYKIRFNQAGTYQLPASRIEAMYSPDIYAELPESSWVVGE